MTKEEWITRELACFKGCREEIIRFIANINQKTENPDYNDGIRLLFRDGYCYYFAKILEDAFGGEICWHKGYGHIVWRDDNKCCYDIEGVFDDYETDDEIVPVSMLGESLEDFRHRGVKFREGYDITNTPYLNIILLDPIWYNTDYTIKEIKNAFDLIPDAFKSELTAEEIISYLRK